jgi:hypothetical protein
LADRFRRPFGYESGREMRLLYLKCLNGGALWRVCNIVALHQLLHSSNDQSVS